MEVGEKCTVIKKGFAYGPGSLAVIVPAQLGFKAGEEIKITFEKVEPNGSV